MRFIPFGGGSGGKRTEAALTISFTASGGTVGIIGSGLTTACHPTMLTTSNGTFLFANGYDPMKRMRPNEKRMSNAGVPSPKASFRILTKEEIDADGSAQVPQEAYRYIHYDYSEFGTVAGKWVTGNQFQYTPQGQLSANKRQADFLVLKNGLAEGQSAEIAGSIITSSSSFLQAAPRFQVGHTPTPGDPYYWGLMRFTVRIANLTSASNPLGGSPVVISGRYQAFMRYVDKDGYVSNPCPITPSTVLQYVPYVYYRGVEKPSDPRVVRRQIFRNVNGNNDVYYLDIDTDDITSDDLVSYNTDEQLSMNFGQAAFDENNWNLFYLYSEPPDDKPFIAEYKGCIFAAGRRVYAEGNVSLVNGSTTITGIGTSFRKTFVGRKIVIGTRQYPVSDVDEAAQTLEITEGYDGPTDTYEQYTIEPYYAEGNLLGFTEPGYPESWLPKELWLQLPEDGDDVTGLMVFANAMWVLKERSISQFTFTTNPARDGDLQPASSRGCISQRMAVLVQNQCLMMDRLGIHVFNGSMPRSYYQANTSPDHLSTPIADLFRKEGDGLRINFNAKRCFWHATHCLELHLVRWYVTMQGYDYPQHSITYDYLLDKWSLEEYPFPITSSCIGTQLLGRPLLGGHDGKVYQPDLGSLDVVSAGTTRHSIAEVQSAYRLVLGDIPPDCVGTTAAIVSGQGRGQHRIILAQTDESIEVDRPFTILPDTESLLQIGAINYTLKTPEYDIGAFSVNQSNMIRIKYRPTTVDMEGYLRLMENSRDYRKIGANSSHGAYSSNVKDPYNRTIQFSNLSSVMDMNMDRTREVDIPEDHSLALTLTGYTGTDKPVIQSIMMAGSAPEGSNK